MQKQQKRRKKEKKKKRKKDRERRRRNGDASSRFDCISLYLRRFKNVKGIQKKKKLTWLNL